MVLGKLSVPGHPTIWTIVGQGPIALAVGAAGGCLDIFTLLCPFCLACEAEARHMYCFSGVVVVVVVGGGGVNFFVFRSFSRKLKGLEP